LDDAVLLFSGLLDSAEVGVFSEALELGDAELLSDAFAFGDAEELFGFELDDVFSDELEDVLEYEEEPEVGDDELLSDALFTEDESVELTLLEEVFESDGAELLAGDISAAYTEVALMSSTHEEAKAKNCFCMVI